MWISVSIVYHCWGLYILHRYSIALIRTWYTYSDSNKVLFTNICPCLISPIVPQLWSGTCMLKISPQCMGHNICEPPWNISSTPYIFWSICGASTSGQLATQEQGSSYIGPRAVNHGNQVIGVAEDYNWFAIMPIQEIELRRNLQVQKQTYDRYHRYKAQDPGPQAHNQQS